MEMLPNPAAVQGNRLWCPSCTHLAQLLGVGAQPLLHRIHQRLLGLQHAVALLLYLRQLAAGTEEGSEQLVRRADESWREESTEAHRRRRPTARPPARTAAAC